MQHLNSSIVNTLSSSAMIDAHLEPDASPARPQLVGTQRDEHWDPLPDVWRSPRNRFASSPLPTVLAVRARWYVGFLRDHLPVFRQRSHLLKDHPQPARIALDGVKRHDLVTITNVELLRQFRTSHALHSMTSSHV